MPRFLHAMCGNSDKSKTTHLFAQNEWEEVRLDPHEINKPDIIGSLLNMDLVDSASFEAALISHALERLYPHEVNVALLNMHRVLNEDGYLIVTCADLQTVCQIVADDKFLEPVYESPVGAVSPIDILFGFRPALAAGQLEYANHCGFTGKALVGTLAQAGFASIWSARNPQLFSIGAIATKKEFTEEELKALASRHFA